MCNHAFGKAANCKISPMPGGVRLVTRRALAAGEECLIDYGALSNDFLLLDYVRHAPNCRDVFNRMLPGLKTCCRTRRQVHSHCLLRSCHSIFHNVCLTICCVT